jgi:two-component system alkaline phosphatase synthesis response regulator PhoP
MTLARNLILEFKELKKESFSKEEIIEVITRLTSSHKKCDLESNGILISPEMHIVYINGKKIPLVKKVFELLYYLIENKNKVCTRESILRDVWGKEVYVGHRTIDVHIRKIRALGLPFIKTLISAYMWEEK